MKMMMTTMMMMMRYGEVICDVALIGRELNTSVELRGSSLVLTRRHSNLSLYKILLI